MNMLMQKHVSQSVRQMFANTQITRNVPGRIINARTLHTLVTRIGSLHSAHVLRFGRESCVPIDIARAGFATSIPSPPNAKKRSGDNKDSNSESRTVESHVVQGDVLHSTDSGDPYIIPKISVFRLYQALKHAEIRGTVVVNAETDKYMRTLISIVPHTELDWSQFKSFVANIEALRLSFLALKGAKSMKLGDLYLGALVGNDKTILDMPIPICTRSSLEYLKEPFEPNIKTASTSKNKVLIMQSANSSVDIAIPFGDDSFIFLDFCTTKKANSSIAVYAGEKLKLIESLIQSIPKGDRPKTFILVLLSIRGSMPEPVETAQLPSNVIVLHRDQVCTMCGELFADRGKIIIEHCANLPIDPVETSVDSTKRQL